MVRWWCVRRSCPSEAWPGSNGSTRALSTGRRVTFACSPENLRLGKAIQVFMQPDRVVAGVRNEADRARFTALMAPIADRIVWMSVESAEMTKHAINAFLATSVAFINELASLCEAVGADAKDVERGLKSDQRIGPGAYLSPGAAFAGGTLARDLALIEGRAQALDVSTPLIACCSAQQSRTRTVGVPDHREIARADPRPARLRLGAHLQVGHRHAAPLAQRGTVPPGSPATARP